MMNYKLQDEEDEVVQVTPDIQAQLTPDILVQVTPGIRVQALVQMIVILPTPLYLLCKYRVSYLN